ncbi:MAG TPA: DUF3413 domain-containing protein, partial [Spirochaetota bacterium]
MRNIFRTMHRQNTDIINARIILLWSFFCILYFLFGFLYISDILSTDYRFIYKVHAVCALFSHALFFSASGAIATIPMSRRIKDQSLAILFSLITVSALGVTFIDIAIFKIYSFHINSYIISEIRQPEFLKSSGIGLKFFLTTVVQFAVTIIITSIAALGILRFPKYRFALTRRRAITLILRTTLIIIVSEKIFMIAISYNRPA